MCADVGRTPQPPLHTPGALARTRQRNGASGSIMCRGCRAATGKPAQPRSRAPESTRSSWTDRVSSNVTTANARPLSLNRRRTPATLDRVARHGLLPGQVHRATTAGRSATSWHRSSLRIGVMGCSGAPSSPNTGCRGCDQGCRSCNTTARRRSEVALWALTFVLRSVGKLRFLGLGTPYVLPAANGAAVFHPMDALGVLAHDAMLSMRARTTRSI